MLKDITHVFLTNQVNVCMDLLKVLDFRWENSISNLNVTYIMQVQIVCEELTNNNVAHYHRLWKLVWKSILINI